MHKYERAGLWVAIGALAVFSVVNYAAIGSIDEVATEHFAELDVPVVSANVIAGIPAGLKEAWQKATEGEADKVDAASTLWLTVPITNVGYSAAGEVSATLAMVPEIKGLYAYSSDGDAFGKSWGGPEVKEGGVGQQTASVEFDADLERGQRHLLFVALAPTDFGPGPYGADDAQRWAAMNETYWNKIEVTAAADAWADDKMTTVSYGIGSAAAPLTADAAPAATEPASEPVAEPASPTGSTSG